MSDCKHEWSAEYGYYIKNKFGLADVCRKCGAIKESREVRSGAENASLYRQFNEYCDDQRSQREKGTWKETGAWRKAGD